MEDVERMARNVYPHLLEWLGKAEVKGYYQKYDAEDIEKVKLIPNAEFNSEFDAITITKTFYVLKDSEEINHIAGLKRFYDKYGVGIYISDKHPYLKQVIIHELIHLAGYYYHYITFNGYKYENSGVKDGVEVYLAEKFKNYF